MFLSASQQEILMALYEAANDGIAKDQLTKRYFGLDSTNDTLSFLLSEELIEYEKQDDRYYLTYEGFELVEKITQAEEPKENDRSAQFSAPLSNKLAFSFLLAFGILVTVVLYLNPDKNQEQPKIEKEVLEELKLQIQNSVDSIRKEERNAEEPG